MALSLSTTRRKNGLWKLQSAMEYLMTYGWAILIIAVVLAALFELGVFNGSNLAPQACIAQAGFVCKNPVYTANGIGITFGQTTGREYFDSFMFMAAEGEPLSGTGIPQNFTNPSNGLFIGDLLPGQTVGADFNASKFAYGQIPANAPIGTPFAGYVWLGYCLSPCSAPTAYSKVATITAKEAGTSSASFGGYFGGGSGSSSPPPAPPPARQFSFTVSVSPTSNTIAAGQSTNAVVTITTPISNNANVVMLSDTAPPILKTFNPISCTPDPTCTSTLSISTTPSAQPGSYPITVTGTNALTGATANAVYALTVTSPYVQITLNPGSTISGTFQQNITFNPSAYSAYESSDLGNIRFCTDPTCSSGYLDSWLEGCPETACTQSSSQAIFWVKLPNGETPGENMYMVFGPTSGAGSEFDGSIAGEAPQLSGQSYYGQYDNGANIFNEYWNFTGPSIPTQWSLNTVSGSTTASDGLTITMPIPTWGNYAETKVTYPAGSVFETYTSQSTPNNNGALTAIIYTATANLQAPSYAIMDYGNPNEAAPMYGYNNGGVGFPWPIVGYRVPEDSNFHVLSLGISPSGTLGFASFDYSSMSASSSVYTITGGYLALQTTSNTAVYQWARVRSYPPNGVMPSVNFGAVQ